MIKGILRADDAHRAVDAGARAIVVSNNGGGGSAGVQRVLEILRDGIDQTLAGLGCGSVHDLEIADLDLPAAWPARMS